jgi:phenylalanyl-tRNA synthetase alpha subunit
MLRYEISDICLFHENDARFFNKVLRKQIKAL